MGRRREGTGEEKEKPMFCLHAYEQSTPYFSKGNLVMTISKKFCAFYLCVHTLKFFNIRMQSG